MRKITDSYDFSSCTLCPRACGADRMHGQHGICHESAVVRVGRAAKHFWEEPCISGTAGSGAVFFSGCALQCVYCQNRALTKEGAGIPVTVPELSGIYLRLEREGAVNINLVTADHFLPQVIASVTLARRSGLTLPVVFNGSGYETVEQIRALEGIVDIYLTDFKYTDPALSEKYSSAPDYPDVAKAALREMVRQHPSCVYGEDGLLREGVIVRHLLLPSHVNASKEAVRYLYETYGDAVCLSIMNQYTPMPGIEKDYPELGRPATEREYKRLLTYALDLGVTCAYMQEGPVAKESFIPSFDGTGVIGS